MKKIFIVLLSLITLLSFGQDSIPEPNPNTWVVDDANILNRDNEISLKLLEWEETYKTGVEYAVVTVKSLEGYDIATYARNIGHTWGVGKGGSNNGIVILIAPNEHKIWVATGYGIEHIITDIEASRFCDQSFPVSELRSGEFDNGVIRLIDLIHEKIGKMSEAERDEWFFKEEQAKIAARQKAEEDFKRNFIYFLLFVIFAIIAGLGIYKLVRIFKIKKDYRKIKDKINIDILSVKESTKILPYAESDIVKEMMDSINELDNFVKKLKVSSVDKMEEATKFMHHNLVDITGKYNKICALIETKARMESDIKTMLVFLSKWKTHPKVAQFIDKLNNIGEIKMSTSITYQYDNIKTGYSEIKNDINVRIEFESGFDIDSHFKSIECARIIANDLKLSFKPLNKEDVKRDLSIIYAIHGVELDANWIDVKTRYLTLTSAIKKCSKEAQDIINVEKLYKNSLKTIPLNISSIESEFQKYDKICDNKVDILSWSIRNQYELVEKKWKSIRKVKDVSSMDTLYTIEYSQKLTDIEKSISDLVKKAQSEYKKHMEYKSTSTSTSTSISSISFDSSSSSSSSDSSSYSGGDFGGGGGGTDW
jgi:uncharacterized protein